MKMSQLKNITMEENVTQNQERYLMEEDKKKELDDTIDKELENLRSNFLTANLNNKSRYNPHVFTEQGLYMLMTILKG